MAAMLVAAFCLCLSAVASGSAAEWAHGIAMHGEPALPAGYDHFPHLNPDAPQGGTLTLGQLGSFDSLNPLIVRGNAARDIRDHVYESLLARNPDEPFSLYGMLAEAVSMPADRSEITFRLRPQARFSDGRPVTAADVLFSWKLLRDRGRPNTRTYYSKVAKAEAVGDREVRFVFDGSGDREIPLIIGLMPILPAHVTDEATFEDTTLEPPVGSGAYQVAEVSPGRRVVFRKVADYWGAGLPFARGRNNFERIVYDYYRDETTLVEAFRKGLVDFLIDDDPTRWAAGYAGNRGDERIVAETVPQATPRPLSALVLNTRRPPFDDIGVRRALIGLFDAEWLNQTLYSGLYERTQGYFDGSALSSIGVAMDGAEAEILGAAANALPPEMRDGSFRMPASDGTGRNRGGLRDALKRLSAAGFRADAGGSLVGADGRALAFEIVVATREQERLALSYARMLKRAGITARVRSVDATQFEQRRQTYDYDVIPFVWTQSLSPGNEQLFYWSAEAARTPGTRNYPGIEDPAVDGAIQAMLEARERDRFEAAVRALDRELVAGFYVIPLFHIRGQWIAYWTRIARPETIPLNGLTVDMLWARTAGGE
ncbi:MAG: extracellular solute-binding protein [Flavobacteriaceae bacterium]